MAIALGSLHYTLPISLYYTTCKVSKPHAKSSLSPSTANSLNSDLRRRAPTPAVNFNCLLITPRHGPSTENTGLLLLLACLLGFSRDRYPASPLVRWLLPSNARRADPKRTLIILYVRFDVFTESLPSSGYIGHNRSY
jgi:hypothetical protein